ncbi:GTP-binding protein [Candidatus Thorarchaeota archaeon]|nr:MAG: GTP-binding protein [Candidatus Thorarchaeota archaeon]
MSSVSTEPDFVYKLVFLGDTGVGKTSLVERYVYDSISVDIGRTIGAILHVKRMKLRDNLYKLVIWDLGGEESFADLREQYCSNASGAFFVYDRTRPETFESMDKWLDALYAATGEVPVVVVENKIDLESNISQDEVHQEISRKVLNYVQTSALEDKNVNLAFQELVRQISQKHENP